MFSAWKAVNLATLKDITKNGKLLPELKLEQISGHKLPWYEYLQLQLLTY